MLLILTGRPLNTCFIRQQGFTLIELVLALVLSGAFLALITPAIRFAIKQPQQAMQHSEASHKAFLVSEYIGRDIKASKRAAIREDMRCIDLSFEAFNRTYCFTQPGLRLEESQSSEQLLVSGVAGRFVSFDDENPRLVDLQISIRGEFESAFSFSRLVVLPLSEAAL